MLFMFANRAQDHQSDIVNQTQILSIWLVETEASKSDADWLKWGLVDQMLVIEAGLQSVLWSWDL